MRAAHHRRRLHEVKDSQRIVPRLIIERWRRHYNEVRPHSSLGYLTPNEFASQRANAASRRATGRVAAVPGPPRPGPLHNPPRKGNMEQPRDAVSKLTVVRKNWAGH